MPSQRRVSSSSGSGKGGDQHGAPSGKEETQTPLQPTFSAFLREAALSSTPLEPTGGGQEWLDVSELQSLSPMKVVESTSGIAVNAAALEQLSFTSRDGKAIGFSLKGFSESWGVFPHPDSYYDPLLLPLSGIYNKNKYYDYEKLDRALSLSLSKNTGDTSVLKVYAYAAFLPRPVASYLKRQLLANISEDGKIKNTSDLLAWKSIQAYQSKLDDPEVGGNIKSDYIRWTKAFSKLLSDTHDRLLLYMDNEQPNSRHPVLLLHQWSGLYQRVGDGKLSFSRFVESEGELYHKITSRQTGTTIGWGLRKSLYLLILQRAGRRRSGSSPTERLISKIEDQSVNSIDKILEIVADSAKEAGYYNIDYYLGLQSTKRDNFDYPTSTPNAKRLRSSTSPTSPHDSPTATDTTTSLIPAADVQHIRDDPNKKRKYGGNKKSGKSQVTCYRCGQTGHYAYECPSKKSYPPESSSMTSPRPVALLSNAEAHDQHEDDLPDLPADHRASNSELTFAISHDVLIGQFAVGASSQPISQSESVRVALDSMSSVNLCSRSLSKDLKCITYKDTTAVRSLHASSIPGLATTLRVISPDGVIALIRTLVVDDEQLKESGCKLLIGYPDLERIGVVVRLPQPDPHLSGGLLASQDILNQAALTALRQHVDEWRSLPGAPTYLARLRPIIGGETKDEPEQQYVYEVLVPPSATTSETTHKKQFDYSRSLYDKLSEAAKSEFNKEISAYCAAGFWLTKQPAWATLIGAPCVTFPVTQGDHKSTRCRPCTDARSFNSDLPSASYTGPSVMDIIGTIRGRYQPGQRIIFMDLSKAFLRLRHSNSLMVKILCKGHTYFSNRILFGLKYGPCSLSGEVLLLLNCAFTALLRRAVWCTKVEDFTGLIKGLNVSAFYDDIIIFGTPELTSKLEQILRFIAPYCGASFPQDKVDEVSCETPVRHLGVNWVLNSHGELLIKCVKPSLTLDVPTTISRRQVFSIAGSFFDPLLCHPLCRLGADVLRAWAGRLPGGKGRGTWDNKELLNDSQRHDLHGLLATMKSDNLGSCEHECLPGQPHHWFVFTDASQHGFGYSIGASVSEPDDKGNLPSDAVILEEKAGAFTTKSRSTNWHINRKELYALVSALLAVHKWMLYVGPQQSLVRSIDVFTDNTSAKAWIRNLDDGAYKSYDRVALTRLLDQAREIRDDLRLKFNLDLQFHYLQGSSNLRADTLSRYIDDFPPSLVAGAFADATLGAEDLLQRNPTGVNMILLTASQDEASLPVNLYSSFRGAPRTQLPGGHLCLVVTSSKGKGAEQNRLPKCYTDLEGIGNLTSQDIIEHLREALADPRFTREVSVTPTVTLFDLLQALGAFSEHPASEATPEAKKLAEGNGTYDYYKLDPSSNLLLHKYRGTRPAGTPEWGTWLVTPRSQAWLFYRYHQHPLLGGHRGLPRYLRKVAEEGWWYPSIVKSSSRLLSSCHTCQVGKHYDKQRVQPVLPRRVVDRFRSLQLDFMGPINQVGVSADEPNGCTYMLVIIDSGTRLAIALPCSSTSTLHIIGGLLLWISLFGPPERIQLDSPAAHQSPVLDRFLTVYGIEKQLGIPYQARCQGQVERLIRDLKTQIRLGSGSKDKNGISLPWWMAVQVGIYLHNHSGDRRYGISPSDLAFGNHLDPVDHILADATSEASPLDEWNSLHRQIEDSYLIMQSARNEKAFMDEIVAATASQTVRPYEPNQKVRLSRIINGKRVVQGPYTIERRHPSNPYLYRLCGRQGWVSLSDLLPYSSSGAVEDISRATEPHRAYVGTIGLEKLPGQYSIDLDDIKPGNFLLVARDNSTGTMRTIYVAEALGKKGDKMQALGLNRNSAGQWKRPLRSEQSNYIWSPSPSSIIGAFCPTATRRIPRQVQQWMTTHGIA